VKNVRYPSSIKNGWADLADSFFGMFVIVRAKFLRKKCLGKSIGKVDSLDAKKYNSGVICPEKKIKL